MPTLRGTFTAAGMVLLATLSCLCQRAVMLDYEGNSLSDNEFVDIRIANPTIADTTVTTTLPDGKIQFQLAPVLQEGLDAGRFTIRTLDGKTLDSSDLKGKVVVLNFWFIGCPACRGQEPRLNALQQQFADRSDVIFVAATPDAEGKVKKYLKREPFKYIQAADSQVLIDHFSSRTYPRNIVIGKDGKIAYWRSIVHAWDKFESVIRSELAK